MKRRKIDFKFWYTVVLAIAVITGCYTWLASLTLAEGVVLGVIMTMVMLTAYSIGINDCE